MLPSIGRLKPAVIFGFTLLSSVFSPYILYIVVEPTKYDVVVVG